MGTFCQWRVQMGGRARDAAAGAVAGVLLALALGGFSGAAAKAGTKYASPECDSCRTVVEQFYVGWEKVVHGLAANGTFESRAGSAPKITYNQDIEDYLQGFCGSEYMRSFDDYIKAGCREFMKAHHRPMVGKFLHGEEKFSAGLSKSQKPQRIRDVCTSLGHVCPSWPPPELTLTEQNQDKCIACQGVVMDATYVLRRSKHGAMTQKALQKKKVEVFELLENLCLETYVRHDDHPHLRNEVCMHMWEEDEDEIIDALVKHHGADAQKQLEAAVGALCVDKFEFCKAGPHAASKAHQEL